MNDVEFLKAVVSYIEKAEVDWDAKYGIGRHLGQIMAAGAIPPLYDEAKKRLEEGCVGEKVHCRKICVECKYHYLMHGRIHLCEASPVALVPTTHPVTGEVVYGPNYLTWSWPSCETINTGDCRHFEVKP